MKNGVNELCNRNLIADKVSMPLTYGTNLTLYYSMV